MADMVNGKRLNMEIDFSANTQKAKREIAELQKQLNEVLKGASKSTTEFTLDEELHKASNAAIELKRHLSNALNIDTGKFDVSQFNRSLKEAGKSLEDYRIQLNKLEGGREAFNSIAKSILNAEVPLRKTNKLLNEFATTLKNTARWQISSSLLHGFMGTLQSAFGYAKDLNESLNNIRIVTGQNIDQMAKFAIEANKAAQSLSTTTTAYTDASLIYYQQGLSDEEVKHRTETTIKMANVSRQSAEEVADQMTSVWNNFNKAGDQSTEHFADIMTALGAKTASSSSEIAEGLSKFAGIADTVGLSFDYAASALATITATSRESADVVGTSLKTIFSRLEGLKLGETLDDGTQLNQYSAALEKIGVNIKDASGELKSMDTILEETGQRWQDLTEDQKMATAQTVAGVRQYTHFITLMDNWNFMQENLQTSRNAEGSLQEQADIYAESWEAAEKRIKSAFEEIYSKILDDDFFIELNNGFADFLEIISNTIDALGGLQGVINTIGLLITTLYKDQLANTLNNFFTTQKQRQAEWLSSQQKALMGLMANQDEAGNPLAGEAYESILESTEQLVANAKNLTAEEQKQAKLELEQLKVRAEQVGLYEKEAKKAKEIADTKKVQAHLANKELKKATGKRQDVQENILRSSSSRDEYRVKNVAITNFDKWAEQQKNFTEQTIKASSAYSGLVQVLGEEKALNYATAKAEECSIVSEVITLKEEETQATNAATIAGEKAIGAQEELNVETQRYVEELGNKNQKVMQMGDVIVGAANGVMSLTMALNSLKGLGDIWSDQDLSVGDKILSTITSLSMALPMIVSGFKGVQEVISGFKPAIMDMAGKIIAATAAEQGLSAASLTLGGALKIVAGEALATLGPFAAIIGAAIALGFAVSVLSDAWNADANAAKEATKAAEGLKQQYEDIKTANEELKSSLEDYNSARSALKDMTMGTQEWKEAVIELNDKVLDLIDKYPKLADKVKNVNGVLELNEEAQQELIGQQGKRVEQAQKASLTGKATANIANEKSQITDEARKQNISTLTYGGDAVLALTGPIGLLIGGIDALSNAINTADYEEALNKVVDAYEQNGNAIFKNTDELVNATGITQEQAEKMLENKNATEELTAELVAQRAETDLASQQVIDSILEEKGAQGLDKNIFGDYLGEVYKKSVEFQNEIYKDRGLGGGPDDEDVQKEYAKAMGYEWLDNKGDNKGLYKVNGQEQEIDDATARAYLAAQKAEEELGENLEDLAARFKEVSATAINLAGGSEKAGSSLIRFMQGTLDYDELTQKEAEELSKLSDKLSEFSPEDLEKLGIDPDKIEELQEKLNNLPKDMHFEQITEGLSNAAKEAFEGLNVKDLSRGAQKAIAETLDKAFYEGGRDTVDEFSKMFEEADKNGKAKEFSETLKNIDWDTIELDELKDQLSAAGVSTAGMDEKLQSLIDTMQTAEEDIATLAQKYGEIHKIIDGLEDGSIISDEDYKKLEETSDEASKYFTTMLDGTHKLTGDAKELYDAVQNDLIKQATDNLASLKEQNDSLYRVKNYKDNPKQKIGNEIVDYSFDTLSQSQYGTSDEVNKYYASLDIIKAFGDQTEENKRKIKDFEDALDNVDTEHPFKPEQAKALAEEVAKCKDSYNSLDDAINSSNAAMREQYLAIAMTARSFKELDQLYADHKITLDAYNQATMNMYESERMEDLDTDEVQAYAEHLQELAGSTEKIKIGTEELSSELEDNADAAEDVSTQIYRMNKAVKDLADNWEEWSSILRESSKGSEEYYKAATGVKKALADLFDISEEYISLDLVNTFANDAEAMELMKKAAKGNGKAIDELREKVTDDIVAHLRIEDNIDTEAFDKTYKQVEKLLDKKINIDIGATLDDTELMSALDHMVKETGMTQGQVNQLLGAIGFTANFASDNETVEAQIPVTTTHHMITNKRPVYGTINASGQWGVIGETWDETEQVSTIYHSEKTTLPVWALATAPPGTKATPKINSITKKAGGSANNFSTSNKGGKPASGGSKGGGGKKGGKGNSKKTETPKESDFDPYWQINQTILKTNEALEKLGEQEDYVFGNQRIKNLEKQNALLKVQTANYKALYKMQKQERAKLQGLNKKDKGAKINAKGYVVDKKGHRAGASKNYGARFDQDGYLANYQKITREQLKKYNAAIKKFNKSAQSDKDQKALDRAEKDYESFKKWRDRYKELTQDEMQKVREEIRQATRQQIENNMEKWNLEIQVGIDTRKAKRDWELFVNKMSRVLVDTTSAFNVNQVGEIKDDYRTAKDYTKDFNDKYKQVQELQGIVDNWATYKANTNKGDRVAQTKSEAKKLLNEAKEELIEIGDNLAQTLGDAWGQYTDLLNSTQEQFDLVNKRLERQGDILEYNRQLIELQYGDKAFKQMKKYHDVNLKYLQQQGSNYKNEKAFWEGQFDDAVQAAIERGKQVDVHNMTTWTDDMKTIYNSMTEAAANYEQIQLKIIEEFKNQYMDEIKKATDAFETFITNGTSFEEMQTEWERRKADADHYLDTTERTYHIQSLMNKIDQSIQTNKNIKAVQKLNQLRKDELNLLSAKEKLTKYDLDAANARYEIALKEIALEESKNNKNTMKLTRNEQGNWSYQYVANTDDILKKEQELSDANYNYYELAKNHWTEAAEELMKLQQSYAEEYERISELMITEPEKAKRELEALNLWYSQENKRLVSEIETYKNDMSSTATNQLKIEYETDFETFSQINADKKKLINDLKETGIQDFHALFTSFSGYGEEAKNALVKHLGNGDESAITQINKALNGIKSKANTIFFEGTDSVSGLANSTAASIVQKWVTDPNSIQNAISNMYSTILDKAKEYKTNTEIYFENIDDNINQVNTDLQTQEDEYKTVETAASTNLPKVRSYFNKIYLLLKNQVIPKVKEFKGSLNKIPKHKTTVIEVVTKYKTIGSPNSVNSKGGGSSGGGGSSLGGSGGSSSGGSSSGTGGNKKKSKGKASSHGYKIGISGSSVVILDKNNHSVKTLGTQTPTYTPGSKAAKKDANKWAKKEGYSGFATGGYTGSWDGNDGKLAVLHQKELVLNADDTKNMLDAVDTIRDVTSLNSSITDSIAKSISGMIAGTTQHILNGGNMTQDIGKNEQYVIENINAEFPNAENVEEIREAIMSLPRLASQYVSRNLK